ncbi:glycoside hydrolase family 2 protein [Rhizobium esperanzae]|uniref:glycoside hydrolase family 2 protein n=1 Tax=Rhizobium esperanzae TaxID=1967781 RepID=UPI001FEFB5D7|nr:sugar-binding domain-containing protein [Rhizobium esperanzae]
MNAYSQSLAPANTPLRETLSLDGSWEFRHETDREWRHAKVPAHWQACFEDLSVSFGSATYRRTFTLPVEWSAREIAIRFGAVSDLATVFINGTEIGRHEGGYLPFEFVIPSALLKAENTVEVLARLPDAHRNESGADFAEIPHGKQSWYGPQGGIWQSVLIEARDPAHISSLRLDPIWPEARLDLKAHFASMVAGSLKIEIIDPQGMPVFTGNIPAAGHTFKHSIQLDAVAPWSPDSPNLYTITTILSADGVEIDSRQESFGFRRFEAKDGFLHLNGKPLYLRAALDQDYYPDGFGAPPSLDLLEDQLRKAKAMGLNCLRCHIKVPDPRYYEVADRLGMLIWSEIPNIETFTPASAERLRTTMEGILARDGNHPSIVIWTLINEDWELGCARRPNSGNGFPTWSTGCVWKTRYGSLSTIPPASRTSTSRPTSTTTTSTERRWIGARSGTRSAANSQAMPTGPSRLTRKPCARGRNRWSSPSSASGVYPILPVCAKRTAATPGGWPMVPPGRMARPCPRASKPVSANSLLRKSLVISVVSSRRCSGINT